MPLFSVVEHAAARAWAAVQGSRTRVAGIECLTDENDPNCRVYRLATRIGRQQSVVAKWRDREFRFERRVQEEILPSVGLPSLEVYGELADPHGNSFWIFFEDAGDKTVSTSEGDARLVARWLAALHAWMGPVSEADQLPDRGSAGYFEHLQAAKQWIANPEQEWPDTSCWTLQEIWRQLDELEQQWERVESICALAPKILVHGDLAGANARLRQSSTATELLVFDWEMAGIGVPCVDLAQATLGSLSPCLECYQSEVRERWPAVSLACVARWAAIGKVFRLLAELDWATQQCFIPECYPSLLAEALSSAGLSRSL